MRTKMNKKILAYGLATVVGLGTIWKSVEHYQDKTPEEIAYLEQEKPLLQQWDKLVTQRSKLETEFNPRILNKEKMHVDDLVTRIYELSEQIHEVHDKLTQLKKHPGLEKYLTRAFNAADLGALGGILSIIGTGGLLSAYSLRKVPEKKE